MPKPLPHYWLLQGTYKGWERRQLQSSYFICPFLSNISTTHRLVTGSKNNLNWSSARFLPIFSSSGISTVRATYQVFIKACFKILISRTVHCFFFCLMNFLSFYWGRLTSFCTSRSANSKHTQSEQLKLISWKKRKKEPLYF